MSESQKPRLAVFKFASCDGCQLSILSLEEDLLLLDAAVDIAWFPEASSRMEGGPYDVTLVEGSVSTPEHIEQIKEIRQQSGVLITIGACATSGGIQALRNGADVNDYIATVYAHPEYIETLNDSTPISEHVQVDYQLWGCPIDKEQIRRFLGDLLAGIEPHLPDHSLCLDCKRAGQLCVLVAKGEPCMGPVTKTGCGVVCPSMGRACYGCFGPAELSFPAGKEQAHSDLLAGRFSEALQLKGDAVVRRFKGINSHASPFRETAAKWEAKGEGGDE